MNWRKFWLDVISRDENTKSETEMDTDDDEVTESDETISTEKSSSNIGTSHSKLFYKWLPRECLKISFLLLNSVILVSFQKWIFQNILSVESFWHVIYRFEDENDLISEFIKLAGITAITISIWMLTSANLTSTRLLGQRVSISVLLILGIFVSFVAFIGIIGIAKKNTYLMNFVSWFNKGKIVVFST